MFNNNICVLNDCLLITKRTNNSRAFLTNHCSFITSIINCCRQVTITFLASISGSIREHGAHCELSKSILYCVLDDRLVVNWSRVTHKGCCNWEHSGD